MQETNKYTVFNIRDYLALGNDNGAGEPMLTECFPVFSVRKLGCGAAFEKSAIEFAKKSQSVTYLAFSVEARNCWDILSLR